MPNQYTKRDKTYWGKGIKHGRYDERWRVLKNHKPYEVSDHGRIRKKVIKKTGKRFKSGKLKYTSHYRLVATNLQKDGLRVLLHQKWFRVKFLVAEEFMVVPDYNKNALRHKDDDEANCRLENLFWARGRFVKYKHLDDKYKQMIIDELKAYNWNPPFGEQSRIARKYNVTVKLIWNVKASRGTYWKTFTPT